MGGPGQMFGKAGRPRASRTDVSAGPGGPWSSRPSPPIDSPDPVNGDRGSARTRTLQLRDRGGRRRPCSSRHGFRATPPGRASVSDVAEMPCLVAHAGGGGQWRRACAAVSRHVCASGCVERKNGTGGQGARRTRHGLPRSGLRQVALELFERCPSGPRRQLDLAFVGQHARGAFAGALNRPASMRCPGNPRWMFPRRLCPAPALQSFSPASDTPKHFTCSAGDCRGGGVRGKRRGERPLRRLRS